MSIPFNNQHCEFETKYRVEPHLLIDFKKLIEAIESNKKFIYVEGPDLYFTHQQMQTISFARYRRPSYGLDNGRCEVTFKYKPEGAKNNIIRKEFNWRVDTTPQETVIAALEAQGYSFNFSIFKSCQIYTFDDATVVFYNVWDTTEGSSGKQDCFVEIEVDEHLMNSLQEHEAWHIIEKYEAMLAPIGIGARNRMRKSLFEIFKR